jgi:hypothetical protein
MAFLFFLDSINKKNQSEVFIMKTNSYLKLLYGLMGVWFFFSVGYAFAWTPGDECNKKGTKVYDCKGNCVNKKNIYGNGLPEDHKKYKASRIGDGKCDNVKKPF